MLRPISALLLLAGGSVLAFTADAIPAAAGMAITALGALWMVYQFVRDRRVRMAEADVVDVHRKVVALRTENDELRSELAAVRAENEALAAELRTCLKNQ